MSGTKVSSSEGLELHYKAQRDELLVSLRHVRASLELPDTAKERRFLRRRIDEVLARAGSAE